jgi:hypothetical protein
MVGGTTFLPSRKKELMKVSEVGRIVEDRKKVNEEKDNTGKIRVTQTTRMRGKHSGWECVLLPIS